MAEIKSSGSSDVGVSCDDVAGDFGPWTAMFMGVDQATHGITFDSSWALLVVGDDGITIGQFVGIRMIIEIGVGPTDPPAEIVWGPMRYATHHTGGGRGNSINYSFPLNASAGDRFWIRIKKDADAGTTVAGVQELIAFLTVSDGVQPIRPASELFATSGFFTTGFIGTKGAGTDDAPTGGEIVFPGAAGNVLSLWHLMTPPGGIPFDTSWLSIVMNIIGEANSRGRWQLGAAPVGNPNPPDLPELIDVGFQSSGGGGSHVAVDGDVYNFPIPWEKGQNIWMRGATITPMADRSYKIAASFWGNP